MPQEARDGPYLNMAVICDRVLKDVSGHLSLIDVLDRVTIRPPPGAPVEMPPFQLRVTLVISLVGGGCRGKRTVKLRPETPAGMTMPELAMPMLFEGDQRPTNAIVDVPFMVELEGLYWFDIFLDEKRITRIPLQIVYHRVGHGRTASE